MIQTRPILKAAAAISAVALAAAGLRSTSAQDRPISEIAFIDEDNAEGSGIAAPPSGPPNYDLSWFTIDGGGETFSTGGAPGSEIQLGGTIGQPDAGPTLTGGAPGNEFELTGGFWPGVIPGAPTDTCPPDIVPLPTGDGIVDVNDLLAVINAWGPCADPNNCPADIAPSGGNDTVNVDDLLAVINGWGVCPP